MGFNLFGRKKAATAAADEARERSARPAVVEHSVEHSAGELERIGANSAEPESPSTAMPAAGHGASAGMEPSVGGRSPGRPAEQQRSRETTAASTAATAGVEERGSAGASASGASGGAGASANSVESAPAASSKEIGPDQLEEFVVDALRSVYDPEIPVNIYDLGLIYDLRIEDGGKVKIKMTLAAAACPVAGEMPGMVEMAARQVQGVTACEVELVWDPAWNPDMMSEAARLQLNI